MKNCTKHFLERWTERIVGIKTEREMKQYIGENQEMIKEHANKTFEHSEFIFKGQIGDNVTRNYHIKDDLVFVTNTTDDAFITIYKVDLGFTDELNATVRKGLIKEIHKLRQEKEEIELQIMMEVEDKEFQANQLDNSIEILKEQMLNLKQQRDFIREEVKNVKSKSLNTGLELKRYTMNLVNSKDYQKDLQSLK